MDAGAGFDHVPVLAREVLAWLAPAFASPGLLVDCTVGGGGHAEALLDAVPGAALLGLDRDAEAVEAARIRLGRFGDRVRLVRANFAGLKGVIEESVDGEIKAVLYDLGVSSPQLDRPERGFQYRGDAPLDMRMDRSLPRTAADVVNTYPQTELARIIARFGEERFARRVAQAIVRRRVRRPFERADDLAAVVKDAIPAAARRVGPHPARRTFQALRIEVNGELEALGASLPQAIEVVAPGGRIAVIAYHSLEDRIAKRTFAAAARGCTCPRDLPVCVCGSRALVRVLTRRPVRPTREEVERNPRADSARLRVAERLGPPAEAGVPAPPGGKGPAPAAPAPRGEEAPRPEPGTSRDREEAG